MYYEVIVPTIADRAKQTLVKLALEPEWEAKFEPNTYGFRPGRSCQDAIAAIFIALGQKTAFVLDADISGCFDNIKHCVLLEKLNTTPTLKRIIKGWLKAGIMEDRKFKPTKCGTIQGGTISPLLACVALYGLEQNVKEELKDELFQYAKKKNVGISRKQAQKSMSIITYADDFVVLHESKELVLKAKVLIEEWLKAIGLELKPSKTRIAHTLKSLNGEKPGFDFLGFSIRHYPTKNNKKGYKLLIKPRRESIKQHAFTIKHKLRGLRGATQEVVIKELNPITRGWSQYYSLVVSNRTFRFIDSVMFRKLWKWAVYRHPTKGKYWIKDKYFKKYKNDNWRFMTNNKVLLIKHGDHAIKRHIKVIGTKSPYDGDWVYWGNRLRKVLGKPTRVIKLLKLQQGKCSNCQLWFKNDDILEIHHIDRNRRNNMNKNLSLLHGHCHDELHRRCA